jgi:hypothetical protein
MPWRRVLWTRRGQVLGRLAPRRGQPRANRYGSRGRRRHGIG